MDKQPSRMQGQGNFIFGSWAEHATIFDWDLKILDLFCGGCPGVPDCGPWSVSTSPW